MQGHVYHWRHGWIPLTHYAALQKAHGSHKGAAKYLNGSDGHHGTESHKLGGHNPHPIGMKVEARQPGIEGATTGVVYGHTPGGMVRVKYTDRHGKELVGTFNPSHVNESHGHAPSNMDFLKTPEAKRAQEEFRARDNANVVARSAPTPGSADIQDAAAKWKRDNPHKKIAGHEREVMAIADELWRQKRLKGTDTGPTQEQATAERERIRNSASHDSWMKGLGLDKPAVHHMVTMPRDVSQVKVGDTATVKGQSASVPGQPDSATGEIKNITTQVITKRGTKSGEEAKVIEVEYVGPSGMTRSRAIVIPTGRQMVRVGSGWRSKDEVSAALKRSK